MRNFYEAVNSLGIMYLFGYGVDEDYHKAREYFELAAKNTVKESYSNIGIMYLCGRGVEKDYLKAKEYFELAATEYDKSSYCNIGLLYLLGQGFEVDLEKAKEYLEIAAEYGCEMALNNLGFIYIQDIEGKRDYTKAKQYFELAAKKEDSLAYCNLGIIYKKGLGTAKDYSRAKYYFELAANKNDSNGNYELGKLLYKGYCGETNFIKAKECFEKSGENGNNKAFYQLGLIYKNGNGFEKDYLKAKFYFETAASQNNSDALYQLGTLYYYNHIQDENYKKARMYFEMSVEKNNLNALFYLGSMYEKGAGVERNLAKSIEYFTQSSSNQYEICFNGSRKDATYQGEFKMNIHYYRSMLNNDLAMIYITEEEFFNIELAEKLLKESAFNEYPFGQNNFGLFCQLYLNHIGNAQYMYERSSKHHFALAEFNLGRIYEKENKESECIDHYKKASDDENQPLVFRNNICDDERLDISKSLIICLINLKLAKYYFSKSEDDEAINFIFKAIFRPLFSLLFILKNKSVSCIFKIKLINQKYQIINLRELILNNPMFHVPNLSLSGWSITELNTSDYLELKLIQQDLENNEFNNSNFKKIIDISQNLFSKPEINDFRNEVNDIFQYMNINKQFKKIENNNQQNENNIFLIKSKYNDDKRALLYPKNFCQLLINSCKNTTVLSEIINDMENIIYAKPYSILFGRIKIYNHNQTNTIGNINDIFYEAFNENLEIDH